MLPIVGVPETIRRGLAPYRDVFCRDAGFEHISRYMTGRLLSPHKTLQGVYEVQVWPGDHAPSRRAMHAAVFEAAWDTEALASSTTMLGGNDRAMAGHQGLGVPASLKDCRMHRPARRGVIARPHLDSIKPLQGFVWTEQ